MTDPAAVIGVEQSAAGRLGGVLAVFSMPYHESDESIDTETLEQQFHWLFDAGADGIVMAMVSEVLRLSGEERRQVAERACGLRDRGAVVISVGAESTHMAVAYARHARDCGADAVMAIPPVAVAAGADELVAYYRRIIEAVEIPVIVQDASGYVGRAMPIEMQARLVEDFGPQRVQFKPEATPIGPKLSELRDATGGRARIFEGSGGIALVDSYRRGIVGTMPAADLVDALVELWRALQAGNDRRAYRIHAPLGALISLQTGLDAFIAIEKYLLVRRGIFRNTHVRGPVGYALDEETRLEVDRLFDLLMEAVHGT